jgi:hypothetical protein
MKEPYEKGVATHLDPESWGPAREGLPQALTGARAGRPLSREIVLLGCRRRSSCGRPHCGHRYCEVFVDPTRSETPCMYGSVTSEPGRSHDSPPNVSVGRLGKSEDIRPR